MVKKILSYSSLALSRFHYTVSAMEKQVRSLFYGLPANRVFEILKGVLNRLIVSLVSLNISISSFSFDGVVGLFSSKRRDFEEREWLCDAII